MCHTPMNHFQKHVLDPMKLSLKRSFELKGLKHSREPGFQYAPVIPQYAQPVCCVWKLKTQDR